MARTGWSTAYRGWLMASFFVISAPQAADLTVNSDIDDTDVNPGDGICATTQNVCSLRAAIQETNALPGLDTVNLPSGTYTLALGSPQEDAGIEGDLDITDSLIIKGEDQATTIIDGNNKFRIFDIYTSASHQTVVELSQVTLTKGHLNYEQARGGAILSDAQLTLTNVTLTDNHISGLNSEGGGLCNFGGQTSLVSVTVSNNSTGTNGGGIANLDNGLMTLRDSRVTGNETLFDDTGHHHAGGIVSAGTLHASNVEVSTNKSHFGGGLFIASGHAHLDSVTITGNTSTLHGAGIHIGSHTDGTAIAADVTIVNSTIDNNEITEATTDNPAAGGGIFNTGHSNLYIESSLISANRALSECGVCALSGGGIYNDLGTVALNKSTVSGNQAQQFGGGVFNMTDQFLFITESIIQDNHASVLGGGLASQPSFADQENFNAVVSHSLIQGNTALSGGGLAGQFHLSNVTIAGNASTGQRIDELSQQPIDGGGAIYNPGQQFGTDAQGNAVSVPFRLYLENVTVADNTANSNAANIYIVDGGNAKLKNSIVATPNTTPNCAGVIDTLGYNMDSDGSCALTAVGDQANVDPTLGPLQDNGGNTMTMAPATDSATIGAIPGINCLSTDQRYFYRNTGTCDIGALQTDSLRALSGAAQLASTEQTVSEATGTVTVDVERIDGNEGAVSVDYIIYDGTATKAANDYAAENYTGTLRWSDGDMETKTFALTITDDGEFENNETLLVEIRNPTGGVATNDRTRLTLTIDDNDTDPNTSGGGGGGGGAAWWLALIGIAGWAFGVTTGRDAKRRTTR